VAFSPTLKENLLKFRLRITLAALDIEKQHFRTYVQNYFPMKHVTSSAMPNFNRAMRGLGL